MKGYFYDIVNGTALPPHQVGVWIPKAEMGPEADSFRPLGMPNTLDRLVDGSVAAHAMHQTAHAMHPSQAVMSYFKEPQKAVSCIQRILDGDDSACTLLADLSKAFERVNPYWILELLRIKRAPRWLFAYTKFILFHRRVSHRVQGRLLPSRTILQGVDMGRSFSVYLFCLAMDPLFTYLNRIPGVLSVQGYIDDTTIAGDAQCLDWLTEVSECYSSLRTAGFVVDPHSCFRACVTTHNRVRPSNCLSDDVDSRWPGLLSTEVYPTALAAMVANCRPGYNTTVVRVGPPCAQLDDVSTPGLNQCIVGIFAFQQILDIRAGCQMHHLGVFATIGCKCKSKSNILTNMALRNGAIRKIEESGFGVQAICAKAPSLGLALVGRYEFTAEGCFGKVEVPRGLDNYNAGPFRKLLNRLKSFSRPTLSLIARCTGFNTFILSVMPYTISYFGLTSLNLNRLRQAAAKFILKRHWLEAEILPYVLRYFGIATLLDPAVSATVAATGLYLREGNPIEELTCHPGREGCCNVRQRSVVLELLGMWAPFLGIEELIRSISEGNGPVPKRLNSLKRVIITRMVQEAKSRVTQKIYNEGWSGGTSCCWIALMTEAPRAWCNGIGRYTLLRWAVNQDDVWLSMRGTRLSTWILSPPMCEACTRTSGLNIWSLAPWSHASCTAYTAENSQDLLKTWAQEWEIMPAHDVVCRACGCGDNTIGHWTRWCIVPLIVAIAILKPSQGNLTLCQLACQSPRHAVIGDVCAATPPVLTVTMPWELPGINLVIGEDEPIVPTPILYPVPVVDEGVSHSNPSHRVARVEHIRGSYHEVIDFKLPLDESEITASRWDRALEKWYLIFARGRSSWPRGHDIDTLVAQKGVVLRIIFGNRSRNTVLKRANSIIRFIHWFTKTSFSVTPFPLQAYDVEGYLELLQDQSASPSALSSFIEAVNFCEKVLNIETVGTVITPKAMNLSELANARRKEKKQASVLSVQEVCCLESFLANEKNLIVDRFATGCFLFALFSRSRWSDLRCVYGYTADTLEVEGKITGT